MFAGIIRKSVRLAAPAVLAASIAGSVGVVALASTDASSSGRAQVVGQVNRDAVRGAGMGRATPAGDFPSYPLRPDGRLRNGLTPNPFTYG
jgi:hypothetical protein